MSLLLLASRKWQAFSLLLASLKFLAGLSDIADVPDVTNGVVGVSAVLFQHAVAGGPAVTGFSAVEGILAGVLLVYWRVQETIGLSDIGSRP